MKKCILSAMGGATAMLILIVCLAVGAQKETTAKEYEHIGYISVIGPEECHVCGEGSSQFSAYWGQDNVGIVDLNTFELLYLPINRYTDQGVRIEEAAGYMSTHAMTDGEGYICAHAFVSPDRGCAHVQLSGVEYAIDRDFIQSRLCQTCLDTINSLWFTDMPPAEFGVVSFEKRTLQPLLNTCVWFQAGSFGIDCEFRDDEKIDLLIHYIAERYKDN